MSENSQKIVEILTLTGVPRRDFDIARPVLQKLSTEELNGRLDRLRSRSERLKAWRKVRSASPVPARSDVDQVELLTSFQGWHDRADAELRTMLEMPLE